MWCVLVKDRSTRIIHTNQKATVSNEFNTIIMLLLKNHAKFLSASRYNNGLSIYNTFLGKLIKRTTSFAEGLKVTTGGGEDIYKSHPFSRVTLYQSYCGIVLSLKSAEKRTCDNMLPVLSEFTQKNFRRMMGL